MEKDFKIEHDDIWNIKLKKEIKFRDKQPLTYGYLFCILSLYTPLYIILLIIMFSLFNLISLSLGFAVFIIIGVSIYYIERRWRMRDLSKTITVEKLGGVEITESVKRFRYAISAIVFAFLAFMIFVTVVISITYGGFKMILAVTIIWIVIGFTMIPIYKKLIPGTSKLRKFYISDKLIKISIPPRPLFQVQWSEFDIIKLKSKPYMHLTGGTPRYPVKRAVLTNELNFIGKNYHKTFELMVGKDFIEKIPEIFDLLKKYAIKMNKEFIELEDT